MNNNHYNKKLKDPAHELRTESVSRAEKYIWKQLLSRARMGTKFKRQRPIHYFIVDFFSQETGLIIEIDGNSHFRKPAYDQWRQQELEQLGYTFLRFTEGEVIQNINDVGVRIEHAVRCLKDKNSSTEHK